MLPAVIAVMVPMMLPVILIVLVTTIRGGCLRFHRRRTEEQHASYQQ
jgi:hypothetical protein